MRGVICGLGVFLASVGMGQAPSRSSAVPWQVPGALSSEQRTALGRMPRTPVDPQHVYTLPELLDLAEQHNPDTAASWQQARVQAAEVGIARAELFPALAAILMSSTTREGILFGSSFVRQTVGSFEPAVEVNYLVLDFGGRSARIQQARDRLLASNLSFNRTILDVLFETERRYYNILNATGQRNAAAINLKNAEEVRDAVDARLIHGLATRPDALEARAAAQQAAYALQAAIGQEDTARGQLLSLFGASPLAPLRVQPLDELQLPSVFAVDPSKAVDDALRQRPELGVGVANRDEARAETREARSAFLPTLELNGNTGQDRLYGQQDQLGGIYTGPLGVWRADFNLRWNLFEGGRRVAELSRTHAEEHRAEAEIQSTRDLVEEQVYTAYIALRTAFAERDAAAALVSASQASYDAALRSYQLGVRNTVDVVSAQRTLAQALSTNITARTDLLTALALLAYRTGDLLQAARKSHP